MGGWSDSLALSIPGVSDEGAAFAADCQKVTAAFRAFVAEITQLTAGFAGFMAESALM